MSKVFLQRLAALAAVAAVWATDAQASLYTLESATFAEDFARRDAFVDAVGRFDTPFNDAFDESTRNKSVPAASGYLAQALRATSAVRQEAQNGDTGNVSPVSFAAPQVAAPDVRALAAASTSNLGSYQGNIWSLMTASLSAPSGNSLYGFAKANLSDIPFEPPATVPLPDSGLLFAGGLLAFAAWVARARRMTR